MGDLQNEWFVVEDTIQMDDDWGYPYDSGNLQMGHRLTTMIQIDLWFKEAKATTQKFKDLPMSCGFTKYP